MQATRAQPRRTLAAWAMFDWANSAFATLVVTFVYATYFTTAIAADEVTGTAQWSRAVGLSGVLVAVLAPPLGALADRSGRRMACLGVCTPGVLRRQRRDDRRASGLGLGRADSPVPVRGRQCRIRVEHRILQRFSARTGPNRAGRPVVGLGLGAGVMPAAC